MEEEQDTCTPAAEPEAPSRARGKKPKSPLAHENFEPFQAAVLQRLERLSYAIENLEIAIDAHTEALRQGLKVPEAPGVEVYP